MSADQNLRLATVLQAQFIKDLAPDSRIEEFTGVIALVAGKVVKASGCAVLTPDPSEPGGLSVTQLAGSGCYSPAAAAGPQPPGPEADLDRWVLSNRSPCLARVPEDLGRYCPSTGLGEAGVPIRVYLGIPIRGRDGEVIGLLKATRRDGDELAAPGPFTDEDALTLEMMARVAGRCIAFAGIAQGGRAQELYAATAWARRIIEETAATELGLDHFLDIVTFVIAAAMQADSCGIFLRERDGKTLTQHGGFGPSQEITKKSRAYPWPDIGTLRECAQCECCDPANCPQPRIPEEKKSGLTAWIAATGRSFHASNFAQLKKHPHHIGRYDGLNFPEESGTECGAFFGTPLRFGDGVVGVIKIENSCPKGNHTSSSLNGAEGSRDFSTKAQRHLAALAQDVALGIAKVKSRGAERFQFLSDALAGYSLIFRCGYDVPTLVDAIVDETKKNFQAKHCSLFLKEGDKLVFGGRWHGPGPPPHYDLVPPEKVLDDPAEDQKVGITVWIAVRQSKFEARSNVALLLHPHHRGVFDKPGYQCDSFMGFPLVVKGTEGPELVGVLKVENKTVAASLGGEVTYFNELDVQLCEQVAGSVSLAIQNARLTEARRKAEINALQQTAAMFVQRLGRLLPDAGANLSELVRQLAFPGHETQEIYDKAHFVKNYLARAQNKLFELQLLPSPAEVKMAVDRAYEHATLARGMANELTQMAAGKVQLAAASPGQLAAEGTGDIVGKADTVQETVNGFENVLGRLAGGLPAGQTLDVVEKAQASVHEAQEALVDLVQRAASLAEQVDALPPALHHAVEQVERTRQIVDGFGKFAQIGALAQRLLTTAELVAELHSQSQFVLDGRATVNKTVANRVGAVSVSVDLRRLIADFNNFAIDSAGFRSAGLVVSISAEEASETDLRRVDLPKRGRYVKLIYADNGPGVGYALKKRIFEPGFSTRGGAGVGLAIAAFTALLHGGCIVENGVPGKGVRFEIYLIGGQAA